MSTMIFSTRLASRWTKARAQLRQRPRKAGGRPVALSTTLAVGALAGLMLAPAAGAAFASFDRPADVLDGARTTPKTARLPRASTNVPVRIGQDSMKAPNACTPAIVSPSRPGPVAYV